MGAHLGRGPGILTRRKQHGKAKPDVLPINHAVCSYCLCLALPLLGLEVILEKMTIPKIFLLKYKVTLVDCCFNSIILLMVASCMIGDSLRLTQRLDGFSPRIHTDPGCSHIARPMDTQEPSCSWASWVWKIVQSPEGQSGCLWL